MDHESGDEKGKVEESVDRAHMNSRKSNGTWNAIFVLRQRVTENKPIFYVFADFEKAFDMVHHGVLVERQSSGCRCCRFKANNQLVLW